VAAVQLDADAEVAAGLSGSAVHGGVGDQFGQAEDGFGTGRAAVEYGRQELARFSHLRGNGGKGTRPREQRGGRGLVHDFSRCVAFGAGVPFLVSS
jgi:hypothetical protein